MITFPRWLATVYNEWLKSRNHPTSNHSVWCPGMCPHNLRPPSMERRCNVLAGDVHESPGTGLCPRLAKISVTSVIAAIVSFPSIGLGHFVGHRIFVVLLQMRVVYYHCDGGVRVHGGSSGNEEAWLATRGCAQRPCLGGDAFLPQGDDGEALEATWR